MRQTFSIEFSGGTLNVLAKPREVLPEATDAAVAFVDEMHRAYEVLRMRPVLIGKGFPAALRAAAEHARHLAEGETGYRLELEFVWDEERVTTDWRTERSP